MGSFWYATGSKALLYEAFDLYGGLDKKMEEKKDLDLREAINNANYKPLPLKVFPVEKPVDDMGFDEKEDEAEEVEVEEEEEETTATEPPTIIKEVPATGENYLWEGIEDEEVEDALRAGINITPFEDGAYLLTNVKLETLAPLYPYIKFGVKESTFKGITALTVTRQRLTTTKTADPANYKVTNYRGAVWDGRNMAMYLAAFKVLLPIVKSDISVYVVHSRDGGVVAPEDDGKFHVYIWAVASEGQYIGGHRTPATLWGKTVMCQDCGYKPSGMGIFNVVAPEDNIAVAELYDRYNLYILYDIVHEGDTDSVRILNKIIEAIIPTLKEAGKPEAVVPKDALIKREKAKYAAAAAVYSKKVITQLEAELEASRIKVKELQRQIVQSSRTAVEVERRMGLLQKDGVVLAKEAEDEFDKIISMDRVAGVSLKGNTLLVKTTSILCYIPEHNATWKFGEYEIKISLDGIGSIVTWNNLTAPAKDGMQHPHVFKNGEACFGSLSNTLPELIGQGRISVAVDVAIKFLESTNPTYTRHLVNWPKEAGDIRPKAEVKKEKVTT
jgi:hypothetical protein